MHIKNFILQITFPHNLFSTWKLKLFDVFRYNFIFSIINLFLKWLGNSQHTNKKIFNNEIVKWSCLNIILKLNQNILIKNKLFTRLKIKFITYSLKTGIKSYQGIISRRSIPNEGSRQKLFQNNLSNFKLLAIIYNFYFY